MLNDVSNVVLKIFTLAKIPGGVVTSDGVLLDANGNPVLDGEGRPLVVAGELDMSLLPPDLIFHEHKYLNIF